MSTLSVDNLVGQTASGVINVKNHVINHTRAIATIIGSTQSITSDSYTDVTGSSYSYTPVKADSKIILHYYGHCRNLGATSQDVVGLTAGTYTCVVTDANGCSDNMSVTLIEPNEHS